MNGSIVVKCQVIPSTSGFWEKGHVIEDTMRDGTVNTAGL